ncbi:MAG: hypothetical protein RIR97_1999 [Pseudomonadota bacterium]
MLDSFGLGTSKAKMQALDSVEANIMVADQSLTITYMNPAVIGLLRKAEADLKKELPRFNVDTLIGSNIDVFHKNPSHQRAMLAQLKNRHKATIRIGELSFDLVVTPLKQGEKINGFVVEWADAKERLQNLDFTAQIAAISRAQAIAEFLPDGTIVRANQNFCDATGYTQDEVKGMHHRKLVERAFVESPAYVTFWDNLRNGQFQAGEYKRLHKDGRAISLQASYNPIMGANGKVEKVVKFALDVTPRVRAVDDIANGLQRLADADLDCHIVEAFSADFEPLRQNFNKSIEQLNQTLLAVSQSVGTIANGSTEISDGANDLSRRTEQQAASLEETAAALDQITANVTMSAKRADEARQVATQANSNATESGIVVSDAMAAMSRIENSSNQISNIIGVIDEIAFQTNLLALNAGVEAARAGDAGRGFAVVAQEVRELAQRSATAAKEIKGLIQASTQEVSTGVTLVGKAGTALKTIGDFIVSINQHMDAIATSAKEQSVGLAEVNTAVNQMDQTTQQNAAMVEQTNAAANSLSSESANLNRMISQFHLSGRQSQRSPVQTLQSMGRAMASPARGASADAPRPARAAGGGATQQWSEF